MSIPEIYLVEPYNAYAPKGRKKHWHEIIEEQSLLARILAEQQALHEAAKTSNTPHVLPPQSPPTSQAHAQAYSSGQGAVGPANSGGGAGGVSIPQFYNPNMNLTASAINSSGSAPAAIQFTIAGDAQVLSVPAVNITWVFGDGTTSGGVSPLHVYTRTGSFTVQMTASSITQPSNVTQWNVPVTISAPALTAAFTPSGTSVVLSGSFYSASFGDTITFTPASNPVPVTYAWNFGDTGTSTLPSPTHVYGTQTGSFTVQLTVSDGLGNSAVGSRTLLITPAFLTASIAAPVSGSSGAHPRTVTFTNGTTIPAIANPVTWLWTFGSGSLGTSTLLNPANQSYSAAGTYTIKLEATGSDGEKSSTTTPIIVT